MPFLIAKYVPIHRKLENKEMYRKKVKKKSPFSTMKRQLLLVFPSRLSSIYVYIETKLEHHNI